MSSQAGPGGALMAYLDHSDLGSNIIAASFVTWAIALAFVLMRFWTRVRIVNKLGLADWVIAVSLLFALAMCVSILIETKNGLGMHIWDTGPQQNFFTLMEAWWFALLFYIITLALTKISILLLYLTIFTFQWTRRACWVVLAIVIITNLWSTATTLTYCIPLEATWDFRVKARFCQSQDAWWANTGLSIATDMLIFILPIPMVLPLKLPRRQKVIVVGIFAVGFFVCIVSLIRLVILIGVKASTDPDFTRMPTDLTYWTVIEAHTAIVVSCTMTLKPLVARLFPRLLGTNRNNRNDGSDSKSDENPSASSSAPPPTIGSRPTRPPVGRPVEEVLAGGGDRVGDLEQQLQMVEVHGESRREKVVELEGEGVVVSADEIVEKRAETPPEGGLKTGGPGLRGPGPWVRSDTSSERTEDLGREMTARSIG